MRFGGFGLGHLSLDAILEKHRESLKILAEQNRRLIDNTSELAISRPVVSGSSKWTLETLALGSQERSEWKV